MIYEKTLNRKILGAKQPESGQSPNGEANGNANGHVNGNGEANGSAQGSKPSKGLPNRFYSHIRQLLSSVFSKKKPEPTVEKEPASMGKILNLMRFVYMTTKRGAIH